MEMEMPWKRVGIAAAALAALAALAFWLLPGPPSSPAPPPPAAPPKGVPAPGPLEAMLRDHARLHEVGAPARELLRAEAEIEARLHSVGPNETVDLLLAHPVPVTAALLLRGVDNGLARDRAAWEGALAAGLERSEGEGFASIALERLRDETRRGRAAARLARKGGSGALLLLAARHAAGAAVAEVREVLWSRVPEKEAVEGLGHVVGPEEATRLESLGGGLSVILALETAFARTGDPAFRESLRRLGK